jgi:hypothetical protein
LEKTGGCSDILINAKNILEKESYVNNINTFLQTLSQSQKDMIKHEEFKKCINVFAADMPNSILECLMRGIFYFLFYTSYL